MKKRYNNLCCTISLMRDLKSLNIAGRIGKVSWRSLPTLLIFVIIFHGSSLQVFSQSSLETLIGSARKNSKSLQSANQFYEAEVMNARTGNSPDNPEIEYAYLWGTPDQLGDRIDFAITQSFDFPTAYSSRSKLSKIKREQALLRLKATEQDIIVKTRQAWFEAVYMNKKSGLLQKRVENARLIANAFQRMFDEGQANQLQLNQAMLKVTALTNELDRLRINVLTNNANISRLNGGIEFAILDSIFPTAQNLVLDTLIDRYQSGPQNEAFKGEVNRMEQQKDVVFNQKLPKIKAGYYQETILGTKLKGITAGITIPLWENANAVKSAKAGFAYAQTDAIRFWEQQELRVVQLYNEWLILRSQVEKMSELLKSSNNEDLLVKALESGEISLTQYYYESDFYFQNQFDLLDFQRDLFLVESELLRTSF